MHADAALGEFAFGVEIDDIDGAADVFFEHERSPRTFVWV